MKSSVIIFPGSNCDRDMDVALKKFGFKNQMVWHDEQEIPKSDLIVLPGGFSYGDYLRCGSIAAKSKIIKSVIEFANSGGLVLGICNGFQILCESGLLPGVLRRNDHLQFRCEWVNLRVENTDSPFSSKMVDRQVVRIPISHGEGNYFASDSTLETMEDNGQILFRYSSDKGELLQSVNPNGSLNNIAGITNEEGNVLGMMPHPERCCDPILGGDDGLLIFESIKDHFD